MKKEKLKIALADFWQVKKGEQPISGFFDLLATKYDLQHSDEPDLLFCSVFTTPKHEHLNYDCMKCLISVELPKRSHDLCDYSLTCLPTSSTNFHFFVFNFVNNFQEWLQGDNEHCDQLAKYPKTRFCNFFQRASLPSFKGMMLREEFTKKLMQYKHVDCPGIVFNNMKSQDDPKLSRDKNKFEFLKHYRFSICFEHTSDANFMAEKLPQALMAGSIPIYWGCTRIAEYFNPKRIINCHDYKSFDDVIAEVMRIENDPELYKHYTSQPAVLPDSKLFDMSPDKILARIDIIVKRIKSGNPPPFSSTSSGRKKIQLELAKLNKQQQKLAYLPSYITTGIKKILKNILSYFARYKVKK